MHHWWDIWIVALLVWYPTNLGVFLDSMIRNSAIPFHIPERLSTYPIFGFYSNRFHNLLYWIKQFWSSLSSLCLLPMLWRREALSFLIITLRTTLAHKSLFRGIILKICCFERIESIARFNIWKCLLNSDLRLMWRLFHRWDAGN